MIEANYSCAYCGIAMARRRKGSPRRAWNLPIEATRQHIWARSRGPHPFGGGVLTTKPCCRQCNNALERAGDCPGALAALRALP